MTRAIVRCDPLITVRTPTYASIHPTLRMFRNVQDISPLTSYTQLETRRST